MALLDSSEPPILVAKRKGAGPIVKYACAQTLAKMNCSILLSHLGPGPGFVCVCVSVWCTSLCLCVTKPTCCSRRPSVKGRGGF